MTLRTLLAAAAALCALPAPAQLIITEVLPGVVTSGDAGDTVELFNAGVAPIDLTDHILTDFDDASIESNLANEGTFAPASLSLPALQPGEFAVVVFVDQSLNPTPSFIETNFGLRIIAPVVPAGENLLSNTYEQLGLFDPALEPLDFVAWHDTAAVLSPTLEADTLEDLAAITGPTGDHGVDVATLAWNGPDAIPDLAAYQANTIDFSAVSGASTYGQGVLRRRSTAGVFTVSAPRASTDWEALPRDRATLGNASDDVPTADGFQPFRITDDLAAWVGELDSSFHPERRIARGEDLLTPEFATADGTDQAAFTAIIDRMLAGEYEGAFADAIAQGYEVVEFLDTASNRTRYLLRERVIPGGAGFRGQGIFIVDNGPGVRNALCVQAPHPIFDGMTLDQAGRSLAFLRPRLVMIAGARRTNAAATTLCDGTFAGGAPYRISDVAHHPDNFFHATHVHLDAALSGFTAIQLHGFCCPGDADYPTLTDDVVVSNGITAAPSPGGLAETIAARIAAQNYSAVDGMPGGDLTTAALHGVDTAVLGGTNNLQGRVTNGVAAGLECNTAAAGPASERFIHIEQDPDVREEPDHILTAIDEALSITSRVEDWRQLGE
ncbi:MAG: lamin tail domain-containing protein [Candidatus Sumerlaeia bacterium]|nr:lamin tail domain-containing protein [Candidatus Sumerlaeia bacterium]